MVELIKDNIEKVKSWDADPKLLLFGDPALRPQDFANLDPDPTYG